MTTLMMSWYAECYLQKVGVDWTRFQRHHYILLYLKRVGSSLNNLLKLALVSDYQVWAGERVAFSLPRERVVYRFDPGWSCMVVFVSGQRATNLGVRLLRAHAPFDDDTFSFFLSLMNNRSRAWSVLPFVLRKRLIRDVARFFFFLLFFRSFVFFLFETFEFGR